MAKNEKIEQLKEKIKSIKEADPRKAAILKDLKKKEQKSVIK